LKFVIFDDQSSNLYYKKDLIDINKKIILIDIRQTIKREDATSIEARKTQKININQILFETITSSRKHLVSTMKASKSTLKILIDENIFFNFALFLVLRDSKLIKRYAKKFETIKTNSIVC